MSPLMPEPPGHAPPGRSRLVSVFAVAALVCAGALLALRPTTAGAAACSPLPASLPAASALPAISELPCRRDQLRELCGFIGSGGASTPVPTCTSP